MNKEAVVSEQTSHIYSHKWDETHLDSIPCGQGNIIHEGDEDELEHTLSDNLEWHATQRR